MEFIKNLVPAAQKIAKEYNILASLIIAQACLESSYGKSGLAINGHNLFGVKGEYNGQSVTMPTTEFKGDTPYRINAAFRKYPSWYESMKDLAELYKNGVSWDHDKYKKVIGEKNFEVAARTVQAAGYATDPEYAHKLLGIYKQEKLAQYDKVPVPKFPGVIKNGSKGENVKKVQKKVGAHADGIFGPVTEKALKAWQKKHGLVSDGLCGPKTWNKMF